MTGRLIMIQANVHVIHINFLLRNVLNVNWEFAQMNKPKVNLLAFYF
jgi:hypothetical protein